MQNPLDPYLRLHKKANQLTTPAYFKRGIISAVHTQSNTIDVQIVGNQSTILKNVPVNDAISSSVLVQGRRCVVLMFDETNANDCVVIATY